MKEVRVGFELAKLCKEKGFDWPCDSHYQYSLTLQVDEQDGTSGSFGWEKGEINLCPQYFVNNSPACDSSNEHWYLCAAPTQSKLQKWLREVHGVQAYVCSMRVIEKYGETKKWVDYICFWETTQINDPRDQEFQTYEAALEVVLAYALKKL